jgi:methylmalonyl-CoA/ethylmalonyl-CoA epimerase
MRPMDSVDGKESSTGEDPMLSLHHIGVAVNDISQAADSFIARFGYNVKSPVIHDPAQTAQVQFLQLPGDSVYLELVSPDRSDSKLTNALNKGGGLNHICYSTSDIDATCRQLRAMGLFLLQVPVPAAAFPGRRIAWFMGQDRIPVELVEKGPPGEL